MSDLAKRACLTVLRHVPPGSERDVVLDCIKFAESFKDQHIGRRHGELHLLVVDLLKKTGEPFTFNRLLLEMDYEALKRARGLPSQIDEVDREDQTVVIDLPCVGIVERKFSAIRRHFYAARKKLIS